MRLKARRKRSGYRTDLEYIRSVYQSNKDKIINNISIEWLGKRYEDSNIGELTVRRLGGIERAEKAYNLYKKNPKKMSLEDKIEWEKNKKEIESKAYQAFKNLIKDQMSYQDPKTKKNYTVERAILREARSKDLNKTWSSSDVFARNFHSLVRQDKKIMGQFYYHENIKKIDYSKYEFMGYYKYLGRDVAVYNYGDSYFLEFQSPKDGTGASLVYLTRFEFELYSKNQKISLDKYRKRSY